MSPVKDMIMPAGKYEAAMNKPQFVSKPSVNITPKVPMPGCESLGCHNMSVFRPGMPLQQHSGGGQMRPGYMPLQMMNTRYPGQQHGNMAPVSRIAPSMGQGMNHPNMMRPMMGGDPGHGYPANMSTPNSVMPPNISPGSMHPAHSPHPQYLTVQPHNMTGHQLMRHSPTAAAASDDGKGNVVSECYQANVVGGSSAGDSYYGGSGMTESQMVVMKSQIAHYRMLLGLGPVMWSSVVGDRNATGTNHNQSAIVMQQHTVEDDMARQELTNFVGSVNRHPSLSTVMSVGLSTREP